MSPANPFVKAAKQQLKARVAFAGPTGSGKTFTALEWATILAGDDGTIAVVDTEHGSASLYADHFDFDVLPWAPPYDPGKLAETITVAEKAGYSVVVLDSISHFWEGEGGTIDIADAAGERARGNSFAGWKVATPALRHLIDTMLGCDMHVIGTMRSKMEYILEEDSRGKKVPKKVGMAPVMRSGVEYEFTMVGDIDLEHRLLFTKSRCSALADVMVQPGRAGDAAKTFIDWLESGVAATPKPPPAEMASDELVGSIGARAKELAPEATTLLKRWRDHQGLVVKTGQLTLEDAHRVLDKIAELAGGKDDPDPDGPGTGSGPDGPSGAQIDVFKIAERVFRIDGTPKARRDHAEKMRHALIGVLTKGETESTSDLTDEQLKVLVETMVDIEKGALELKHRAAGDWQLVTVPRHRRPGASDRSAAA